MYLFSQVKRSLQKITKNPNENKGKIFLFLFSSIEKNFKIVKEKIVSSEKQKKKVKKTEN